MDNDDGADFGYAHSGAQESAEGQDSLIQDLDTAYVWLDQLRDDFIEDCDESETEFGEEIDRNNLRTLMSNIGSVEHVKLLLMQREDPRHMPKDRDLTGD